MTDNIERLLVNYSNARKSFEAWCYLNNLDLKICNPELRHYVDNNDLLYHLRYIAHKDFYIELYKILRYKKDNKDNIISLLKTVNPNESKYPDAIKILSEIDAHQHVISRINNIRDKFYAHLDPEHKEYINKDNSIEDLYQCFYLIESSIIVLTSKEFIMTYLDKIPSRDEFNLTIPVK